MKKFVLKLDLIDGRDKRKALKTVASLPGIDGISMDMKEKKLTVIGIVDPINVISKLRKFWPTDLISLGPAVEPEKKEEPKEDEKKVEQQAVVGTILPYRPYYYPHMNTYRPYYYPINTYNNYVHHSVEENPNGCIIL